MQPKNQTIKEVLSIIMCENSIRVYRKVSLLLEIYKSKMLYCLEL